MVYLELIFNLTLLVALSTASGLIEKHCEQRTRMHSLLQGILFGGAAVLGMLRPLDLGPGLIFDGRSVMVSLCALFFGPWAAAIASGMAVACRMEIGGLGAVTGSLVILSSAAIGLLAHLRLKPDAQPPSIRFLYVFGCTVTLAMLALMFTLPEGGGPAVVQRIGPPVLLLYPLATILVGKMLSDQIEARGRLNALRESEEIFHKFMEHSPIYTFFKDDQLRALRLSANYEVMLGKPMAELLGKTMDDLFPSDLAKSMIADDQRILLEGKPVEIEEELNGRYYFTVKFPICSEGKPQYLAGFTIDITARKRAEEALRRTNAFLNSIIDNIPNMLFLKTAKDLRFVRFNRAGEELLGYSQAELLGKNDYDFFSKKQAEFFIEKDRQVLRDKEVVDIQEEALLTRDKGERFLHTRKVPILNEKGEAEYLLGISEDITEHKRAGELIKFNEARLESLLRINQHPTENIQELLDYTLEEAIALTGSTLGYIYFYNEAKREFTLNSWSKEVMHQCTVPISKKVCQLADIGIWGEAVRQRRPVVMNDFAAPNPLKKGMPEGHPALHTFLTIPVTIEGHIVAVVGVANKQDAYNDADIRQLHLMMDAVWKIVHRKRAEEARVKLQAQFNQAQKMESIGRLAGGVAHDFNNMLGIILGYTEMALNRVAPSDPLHTELSEIFNAAKRSADITGQLLAFARKQTVTPRVLALNEAVEGMFKMLHRLIGENIDLIWIPQADLWPIKMDISQINQILVNLCVNARDAIVYEGKIVVETKNVTLDAEYCANHAGCVPGEYVSLVVRDNGCGMDKETLDNLFEPFFTTKDLGKGTGLGMATVYGIVSQNNGFILVHSEVNQGAIFTIYLPRYTEKTELLPKKDATPPAGRDHETILLVEDETVMLNMTKEMLQLHGYTVLAAATPGEAIELAERHAGKIHLLISDVIMPEMNGRDMSQRLLAMHPDLKLLFMSGYTADIIAYQGVLAPGVNFIQKPFLTQDLATKVREVLEHG